MNKELLLATFYETKNVFGPNESNHNWRRSAQAQLIDLSRQWIDATAIGGATRRRVQALAHNDTTLYGI